MQLRKILISLLLIAILLSLALIGKFFIFDFKPQSNGALQVNSIPKTAVYLNGESLGQTPLDAKKIKPGEYQLKLVPVGSTDDAKAAWETKIKISSETLTYVSREIGPSADLSSGQILTLEKIPPSGQSEIVIVSSPDGATVAVDGLEKGKTSLALKNLSAGDRVVVISLPGFNDQVVRAKVTAGYRLNVLVNLSKSSIDFSQKITIPSPEIEATKSSELAKPYVLIKDTPLGFLRVRSLADVNASESGKVLPGEKYPLLSQTDGWVKIKLADGEGWVSENYVSVER